MLFDQENTKRNVPAEAKQSGNCLHCHGSIMPLYRKLGKEAVPEASEAEQIQAGLVKVSELCYWDAHKALEEVSGGKAHPVSCVDCHDPQSMELRVTRPAFIAGIQKLAASTAAVPATCPSIEALAQGRPGAGPTTRTSTAPARRSAPTPAASATSSTSAARARPSSSPGRRGSRVEQMEHALRLAWR